MSAIPPKVQGFDLPDTWRRKRIKYVATYNDETLSDDTDEFKEIEYIEISGVSLVGGVENVSSLQFHKAPTFGKASDLFCNHLSDGTAENPGAHLFR